MKNIAFTIFALALIGLYSCEEPEIYDLSGPIIENPDTIIIVEDRGVVGMTTPSGDHIVLSGHAFELDPYPGGAMILTDTFIDCQHLFGGIELRNEYSFFIQLEPGLDSSEFFVFAFIVVEHDGLLMLAFTGTGQTYKENGMEKEVQIDFIISERTDEYIRGRLIGDFIILSNINPSGDDQNVGTFSIDLAVPFDIDC